VKLRRIVFWSILSAAMVAGCWWVLYIPYKPDSVLSAIPAEATVVSIHNNLSSELDPLLENHLVRNALVSAGVKDTDLSSLLSNKTTRAWINRLAGDRTVIAYVPALGYQQKPAWVFATWIGNHSQRFRWKIFWFRPKTIRQSATEYGRIVYEVRTRLSNPKEKLSLSLTEGVLVGCLSEDPAAARYLVQTFDHQYGRASIVSDGTLSSASLLASSGTPHRGWIRTPRRWIPFHEGSPLIAYTASVKDNSRLELSLAASGDLPLAGDMAQNTTLAPLLQTLGTSPDAALVMPISWIKALMPDPQTLPLWVEIIQPLVETNATPSLGFISILNRDHGGRIRGPLGSSLTPFLKGLRVPSLILGIQVSDEQDAARRIALILDQLNSRYGLGLIPHPIQTPDGAITLIEESRKNLYGKFEPDERIAWTHKQGWMFLASNAAILKRLMANASLPAGKSLADARPSKPAYAYAPWMTSKTPTGASLWIDTESTGKLIKDAISAVTISLMVRNADGTQETRRKLEVARQWMEKLQGINEITITTRSTNGVVNVDLILKASEPPLPLTDGIQEVGPAGLEPATKGL
jgi:hypothetical protein